MERDVFFVSDRTGITAETLGLSLLTQFNGIKFIKHAWRFVDTLAKAREVAEDITRIARATGRTPLVFSTLIDEEMRQAVESSDGVFFDLVETFIAPLEVALGQKSSHMIGRARESLDQSKYTLRMDAVNYALVTDDGLHTQDYGRADVLILGVSRSGKTPTCLYLALTYGIYAANYPLMDEDLEDLRLPPALVGHRHLLYGLTISPQRLHEVRRERKGDGAYAALRRCQYEIAQAEALYRSEGIPYIDTTSMSVEEIATTILHQMKLAWRLA